MNIRQLIGLDFETTGLDTGYHRPIQLGLSVWVPTLGAHAKFSWDIGWDTKHIPIDDQALRVNGFTHERIRSGHPVDLVDREAAGLLRQWVPVLALDEGEMPMATGWNVGFDVDLMKRYLPEMARFFHYRAVDLTGVEMAAALAMGISTGEVRTRLKAMVEGILQRAYDITPRWHDAGYDALASTTAAEILRAWLIGLPEGCPLPPPPPPSKADIGVDIEAQVKRFLDRSRSILVGGIFDKVGNRKAAEEFLARTVRDVLNA